MDNLKYVTFTKVKRYNSVKPEDFKTISLLQLSALIKRGQLTLTFMGYNKVQK